MIVKGVRTQNYRNLRVGDGRECVEKPRRVERKRQILRMGGMGGLMKCEGRASRRKWRGDHFNNENRLD